jgi:hypothetical protein
MTTQLPFDRNTAHLSVFSTVRNIIIEQNSSIQVNGGITISLVRKPSMFEAEVLALCFPLRIESPFERNTA